MVEKNRRRESADNVWKQLNAQHQHLFLTRADSKAPGTECEIATATDAETASNALIEAALNSQSVLVSGKNPKNCEARGSGHTRLRRNRVRYSIGTDKLTPPGELQAKYHREYRFLAALCSSS